MADRTIGVGILGMGFMGSTHAAAYRDAARDGYPCRVVAVADGNAERLTGAPWTRGNIKSSEGAEALFDPRVVRTSSDPASILADPEVDLVSICTHTHTHIDLATAALRAGKHVLVEKPVALRAADVRLLADEAARAGRLCVPAMCMRYWPGWTWLKEQIDSRVLGNVRSVSFQRLGSRPAWGDGFYDDPSRSGGALFDLHIHDADFIWWCMGPPRAVSASGSIDHVSTIYRYGPGTGGGGDVLVTAEGGWIGQPGWKFRMRYLVEFEGSTADFDIGRDPPLLLYRGEECLSVALPAGAGYRYQARAVVDAIARAGSLPVTIADAAGVTALVEAEKTSLEQGREVPFLPVEAATGTPRP